jgi:hypothetical protein
MVSRGSADERLHEQSRSRSGRSRPKRTGMSGLNRSISRSSSDQAVGASPRALDSPPDAPQSMRGRRTPSTSSRTTDANERIPSKKCQGAERWIAECHPLSRCCRASKKRGCTPVKVTQRRGASRLRRMLSRRKWALSMTTFTNAARRERSQR